MHLREKHRKRIASRLVSSSGLASTDTECESMGELSEALRAANYTNVEIAQGIVSLDFALSSRRY